MQINVTLVIQIINFFITYKVLNAFLFRPAIDALETKQKKKDALQNQIDTQEEELITIEKEKVEAIVTFQNHVKKCYPFIQTYTVEKQLEFDITPQPKMIDKEKLEKQITDWLVEKVPHDF